MTKEKKGKSELNIGDLVLAKVKGYPAWPAKISRPEDWDEAPVPRKYFVYFFGTQNIAFVAPADIQAFTSEVKKKLLARCQAETEELFASAVKEICQAYEKLHRTDSASSRDAICKSDVNGETGSAYPTVSTAATAAAAPPADGPDLMLIEAKMMHHCAIIHGLSKIIFKERAEMGSRLMKMESQVRVMEAALDLSKSETKSAVSSLEKERCNAQKRFADFEREKVDVETKRQRLAALGSEVVVLKERVQSLKSSLAESVREKNEAVKAREEASRVHREVEGTMAGEMIRLKEAHEVEKLRVHGEGEQKGMLRVAKENICKMNTCYRNGYADALKQAGVPHSDPVWMGLKFPYPRHAPRVTAGWGVSAGTGGISVSSSVPVPAMPVSDVAPSQAHSP